MFPLFVLEYLEDTRGKRLFCPQHPLEQGKRRRFFMALGSRMTPWEREWKKLNQSESRFLSAKQKEKPGITGRMLEKHIPPKLQDTLDGAFRKAFELMFTKGSPLIEKTYNKKKRGIEYQVRSLEDVLLLFRPHICCWNPV